MSSRTTQLQAALSTAQQVANTFSTTAAAVESLGKLLPIDRYLRRRVIVALVPRAAWGLISIAAIGVGYWGVSAAGGGRFLNRASKSRE